MDLPSADEETNDVTSSSDEIGGGACDDNKNESNGGNKEAAKDGAHCQFNLRNKNAHKRLLASSHANVYKSQSLTVHICRLSSTYAYSPVLGVDSAGVAQKQAGFRP